VDRGYHAYVSDAVLILILLHVAGVAVVSRIQRDNLTRAMITGRKRLSKRMNAAPS
jgi:cytochrome b